jgi:hypothetical protein
MPQQEVCVFQRLKQPPFVITTFPRSATEASPDAPQTTDGPSSLGPRNDSLEVRLCPDPA